MLELKKFSELNSDDVYEFYQQLGPSENGFENNYYQIDKSVWDNEKVPSILDYEVGKNLNEGHVADTKFFLIDDGHMVAVFNVRHYLNDFLRDGPGHIGFAVRPKDRKHGYATIGLKMAVEELKKMKDFVEDEVYISCNKNNLPSLRAQLKAGAYMHHEDDKEFYQRIKVR